MKLMVEANKGRRCYLECEKRVETQVVTKVSPGFILAHDSEHVVDQFSQLVTLRSN